MIGPLRHHLLRLVLGSLLVSWGAMALLFAVGFDSESDSFVESLATFLAWTGMPLSAFLGSTVLNLYWWASIGMLLAALVVAHRQSGEAG